MLKATAVALALGLIFMNFTGHCYDSLQVGYYEGKCGSLDVEAIVGSVITSWFHRDQTITAALLRMQFHDCFVNGCDASILLDGSNSEKTAQPNLNLRGFDIIDAAKAALEKVCPGVVSCADIIVMATRDAVSLSEGGQYNAETGRRDGLVSLAANVHIPTPFISVPESISAFANKGLNTTDMVYLLGGHSVGVSHCSLFQGRLYNFQDTEKPDPTMDTSLLSTLKNACPRDAILDNTANLDQGTVGNSTIMDNTYYQEILMRRGILQLDQELALHPLTNATVKSAAIGDDFSNHFGQAMVKFGAIQVLTGIQGEIRRSCRAVNTIEGSVPVKNVNEASP
ncbi:hypothetical protein RJ640_007285, partial [Escallonia rubra]